MTKRIDTYTLELGHHGLTPAMLTAYLFWLEAQVKQRGGAVSSAVVLKAAVEIEAHSTHANLEEFAGFIDGLEDVLGGGVVMNAQLESRESKPDPKEAA